MNPDKERKGNQKPRKDKTPSVNEQHACKLVELIWRCDKDDCGNANNRIVSIGTIINDDVCDYCETRIHEPLTIKKYTKNIKK